MTSATEDELLDALIWSDDSYSLTEFITEFPLPQVVRVVRGHDGGTDSSTLGYGEVLTIHAVRETRVLSAEDRNGNAISVGLDFPDEVQILPQTKDCRLNSCEVTDFASFYQTVKYVEVIQAHYGTGDNVDSTSVGEILEIVDISKPHKPGKTKVQVRNSENNQKSTLTSTCSARFRPLLDWKKYKAPELKTHQFGFPVRVRFMDTEVGKDTDYQRLISKSPDINIINEIVDIIVITTTVSSDPVLKFCFEIPKDLEIKVAVAEGFSNGAKHYTDIVTSLNERFDVTKFMSSHQPAPIKRRDVVKQYDYDTIKEYIIDNAILSPKSDEVEPDIDAPPLPPRTPKAVKKSQSFDIPPTPPLKVPDKNVAERKNSAPTVETTPLIKPKPAVPSRPRSISQREGVGVEWIPSGNNYTHALSTSVLQSTNENPCDPSPPEVKVKPPINIPTPSPNVPQSTNNHPNDPSQAERKVSKPPLKIPRNIPVPSTNVPQTTSNHPNDLLQAELKDIVARKRPMKVPVPPPRPRLQDKTSKHPQANNVNEVSEETNLSNKEKEISESEIIQTAEEVPGVTDCTPVTQTTINHPASAILQLPPRPPARDKTSKHPQANNVNEISTETNPIFKQKESSQPTNIQSAAKVPGGTDGTTVTQTTIDHPASPISQMDENENAQRPPRVVSPKLPPRDRRPKLKDSASNFQGDIIDEIPRASGQREIESQQMVKDEKTDTQHVPKLPPKSPGRKRRDLRESHYVQPVALNIPGYLPQSVVSRTLPHTPPPSRNPPIDRFQRPGTLPKNYKIGGNQPYREQVEENEEIYETPYDPPIMTVAPQMNPRRPQSILNENPYELVAKVPLDLSGLSINEVSDILKNLNMGQYAERFEDEMVDGDLLKELKESDLESFRMESIHRTKLLKFVQGWRPQHITKKHA
ncbi:SH3 and multiple ankyrin repeat domains 2-like [Paramuricea clavata]|uniref:SH3 and multiple ankyrin repeat domains 2-like n=1 Tax=Paramuricea clavata TaxID=317549 RepID=A0A6S7GSK3_PARCT|nr:SH3 and multiple ankyrin repeat domains 2-like [Paramuricea clavata]